MLDQLYEDEQATEARYQQYLQTLATNNNVSILAARVACESFAGKYDLPGIEAGTLGDYISHAHSLGVQTLVRLG